MLLNGDGETVTSAINVRTVEDYLPSVERIIKRKGNSPN